MSLTMDDVQHVASLARIGLTDEEAERMREKLKAMGLSTVLIAQ